jgi:N6-adenosine-specific RNA methylase IME4
MSYVQPDLLAPARTLGAWPFGDLEQLAYNFIMADPPWRFDNWSELGDEKGPEPHYETMADEDILALPVGDLARESSLLWLWGTWPKLELGMACLERWGFQYKTGGAWDKKRWGTGHIWRSLCEPVLIGTRGSPKVYGASVPNLISESRRQHSRKPDAAYAAAEKMMPHARRVSLFERPLRKGWEAWGDGVGVEPGRRRDKRVKATPPLLAAIEEGAA